MLLYVMSEVSHLVARVGETKQLCYFLDNSGYLLIKYLPSQK